MLDFMSNDRSQVSQLIGTRTDFDILIPDEITKFSEQIPGVDFSELRQVPPTPSILTPKGIAHVLVHGGQTLDGLYVQMVVFTYARNGTIHYLKDTQSNGYIAEFRWEEMED